MDVEGIWTQEIIRTASALWSVDLSDPSLGPLLEPPSDPRFGDAASGVALRLAGRLKKAPRAIAEALRDALPKLPHLESVEIAGPGFLNFRATIEFHGLTVEEILRAGPAYGRSSLGQGRSVLVEHCSANPTGPLHIAHGRQAAVGDTLANLLDAAGYRVEREFYVNDTGGQIENLGKSILWRLHEALGRPYPTSENYYQGDYIRELAEAVRARFGVELVDRSDAVRTCAEFGKERLLEEIRKTLEDFRVRYDTWYSQDRLEKSGKVEAVVSFYQERGWLYEKDGARYFRSSGFGDPEDRILIKSDGSYTYRTPDIAYHRDKFARGFDGVVDLWGPDHHAHIATVRAGLAMLGLRKDFDVLLVQHCKLLRGGIEVKMSKRAASYVTLRELMDEVGVDAARYFFVMRKTNSHLEFDIEVAKRHSLDNPVYYAQYAHARISGIYEKGREKGLVADADLRAGAWNGAFDPGKIGSEEIELVKACRGLRRTVESAARGLDPTLLTDFVSRLSGVFQRYYQKPENVVLCPDEATRRMRLAVCGAVQTVLRNAFGILGISAPERL